MEHRQSHCTDNVREVTVPLLPFMITSYSPLLLTGVCVCVCVCVCVSARARFVICGQRSTALPCAKRTSRLLTRQKDRKQQQQTKTTEQHQQNNSGSSYLLIRIALMPKQEDIGENRS